MSVFSDVTGETDSFAEHSIFKNAKFNILEQSTV